jgi:SAM-dependent methyltransferase
MSSLSEQTIQAKRSVRRGVQTWKVLPIIKGSLTWLPLFNAWRKHRASTGGTDTPRYCYSVWLRHLTILHPYGFKIAGARVGELGPGDSIGIGLAALISGAAQYVGLDIVPFSAKASLETIFDELVRLYSRSESIPDNGEFPRVRPTLDSYEFPIHLIDIADFSTRADMIRNELRTGLNRSQIIKYQAPWTSPYDLALGSLDLIFSQAVLEHVDNLEETYLAMSSWLRPGGFASHVIDFSAHYLSPFWNGHWAYSDLQWRLVRGRREFLLNREALNKHLASARKAGFEVLLLRRDYADDGLHAESLFKPFRLIDIEDARTRGAVMVLHKR